MSRDPGITAAIYMDPELVRSALKIYDDRKRSESIAGVDPLGGDYRIVIERNGLTAAIVERKFRELTLVFLGDALEADDAE